MILAGCSSLQSDDFNITNVDVEDCRITEVDDPAASSQKGVLVCIVFNDMDCPVDTVYDGDENGAAELDLKNKNRKKLIWQAVKRDNVDPDKYHSYRFSGKYEVIFDPFKGYTIASKKNKGWARSRPLECTGDGANEKCPPGVEYKYTVWVPDADPAICAPHDPMFRVNN
jgi:hypothetical protein